LTEDIGEIEARVGVHHSSQHVPRITGLRRIAISLVRLTRLHISLVLCRDLWSLDLWLAGSLVSRLLRLLGLLRLMMVLGVLGMLMVLMVFLNAIVDCHIPLNDVNCSGVRQVHGLEDRNEIVEVVGPSLLQHLDSSAQLGHEPQHLGLQLAKIEEHLLTRRQMRRHDLTRQVHPSHVRL
jgi:hypothetical protein